MVMQPDNSTTASAPPTVPVRRHPDLFTKEEAAAYLCMDSVRTLEWAEKHFQLCYHMVGQSKVYHRADLDACVLRLTGKDQPQQQVSQPKRGRA